MTTLTKKVTSVFVHPQLDGLENVIYRVEISLNAIHEGTSGGIPLTVDLDPSDSFTPYDELTEEQVLEWVESTVGAEQMARHESTVIAIAERPQPEPLPWTE